MMRELVKEAKDKCPPNARAHGVSNGKRTLLAATRWSAPNLLNKGLHLTVSAFARPSLRLPAAGKAWRSPHEGYRRPVARHNAGMQPSRAVGEDRA